jgi:hypothetical protein
LRREHLRLASLERAVNSRAVFGDFLDGAHEQFSSSASRHEAAQGGGDVQQVNDSLLRLLILMSRYVQDVTVGSGTVPARGRRVLTVWGRAGAEAREALSNAAASLHEPGARRRPGLAASELARRLDAAAVSLAAGRDLLHTHLGCGPGGERELRSEWGLVVTSPGVTRAVLAEIGVLARQIAPLGARFALAPSSHGAPWARRKLNAACQWLWVLNTCVEAAQREDPVPPADMELLCAIPVNTVLPRRLPSVSEPVAGLCAGVISTAERLRHAEWEAGQQPPWSPGLTADSLRRVAVTSTVTSHNCRILLRSLAFCMDDRGDLRDRLLQAAEAAGHARDGWVQVAHALDRVTTDTRGVSPSAAESADLALWTGRLAYADPEWTLVSGPAREPRLPENLAPGPADVPLALSAIHYACDTLTSLAYVEREQIRAAGAAQRILVPTRSLPDTMDVPRPFAPALLDRIDALVSLYEQSGRAAGEATARVGEVAAPDRAPSRVLTSARAAVRDGYRGDVKRARSAGWSADPAMEVSARRDADAGRERRELPGPVERTLHDLGVTDADLLQRGANLDRASELLIIGAAARLGPQRLRPSAVTLSRSGGNAGLINHALASGDTRATALLQRGAAAQPQPREAEL